MTIWKITPTLRMQNGTNLITNDTDGDDWNDGPEVYYQDHDDDGMARDGSTTSSLIRLTVNRMVDTDGDGT